MKEYQVRIVCVESGTVYVMADSEDDAIEKAKDALCNGKVEMDPVDIEYNIEWVEDDECDR